MRTLILILILAGSQLLAQQPIPSDQVLKVGGDVSEPIIVVRVDPQFPVLAKKDKIKASSITVAMDVVIDRTGDVRDVAVIRPMGHGFDEMAVAAVKQWKFIQAKKDGTPVNVSAKIAITFSK